MALFESYDKKRDREVEKMLNKLNLQNLSNEEEKNLLKEALGTYYGALNARYIEDKAYIGAYAAVEMDLVIIKMLDELLSRLKEKQ